MRLNLQRAQHLIACLLIALAAMRACGGDNWPEFRGPTGDGHAVATGLPLHWSETENIRWKTPIHDKGWSSPVIWGNQIWLTTATADGKQLYVLCVDRDSGKIVHDIKLFDVAKPGFCPEVNSYASPTPVIEAGRVYVSFGSYGTACLDTATGKTIWSRRDLPCDHWRAPGASPILCKDLLYLSFDGYDLQYVAALDKTTGQTRWQRPRSIDYGTNNGDLKKAFCTPSIVPVNGRAELICPCAVATVAYDALTGAELWKVYHGGMNASARPIFGRGLIYICPSDGPPFKLVAVRPEGRGDITHSAIAWRQNQGVPNRTSLVLVDDLLYMVSSAGVASCLQASDGSPVWQKRLGGEYFASPVYADGRLYFFNTDGVGSVTTVGRKGNILSRNRLADGCMASPAIVGKALYVRTKTHLYRIEN